ncbi:MAG: Acyl-CoA dehydrogenase family protein, partial [uncultured Nocardioides sp.]
GLHLRRRAGRPPRRRARPRREDVRRLRDPAPGRGRGPGLRREALDPDGRDGPAGPALRRGGRRRRRRPGRDRHRVPRDRPRRRARALPHLRGAGWRAGLGVRHPRAAPGGAGRAVGGRERARLRPRRARPPVGTHGRGRHRHRGRRLLEPDRGEGARAPRCPGRRPGRQRGPARRRHRPLPGGRRRRRPQRLRGVRREPGRAGAPRRHRRDAARPPRPGRHEQHRDRAGHHPRDGRQPGPGRHAGGAAVHHGLPQEPQAVRRHPEHLPGTDVPGRRHVRLAGAHPQHGRVGHHGGGPGRPRRAGRRRLAGGAAGQPRGAPHRPGGDPAARRHRHDRGVRRRHLRRAPDDARPPARRGRLPAAPARLRRHRARRPRPARL